MIRATTVVRRPAVRPDRVADTLTLDHGDRHRRRLSLTGDGGLSFLLDLDRATVLDDGDAVKLEDGRLVQIKAKAERLIEVRTENPLRLMKVGWHLGNRHVATEITADALYVADDHVLLDMLRGLGAATSMVERPFRPEKGAYEGSHEGHDHGHEHHDHDHGDACGCGHPHHHHEHSHSHANAEAQAGHGHAGHEHAHEHHAGAHGHSHAEAHSHVHDHAHEHHAHGDHAHGHRHG